MQISGRDGKIWYVTFKILMYAGASPYMLMCSAITNCLYIHFQFQLIPSCYLVHHILRWLLKYLFLSGLNLFPSCLWWCLIQWAANDHQQAHIYIWFAYNYHCSTGVQAKHASLGYFADQLHALGHLFMCKLMPNMARTWVLNNT